jgi:ATP-dependent Lhr-like helicase
LLWLTYLTDEEVRRNPVWPSLVDALSGQGRVARLQGGPWIATERRPLFESVFPQAVFTPDVQTPAGYAKAWDAARLWLKSCAAASKGSVP